MDKINVTYLIDDDEITIYLADRIMKKMAFTESIEKFNGCNSALNRLKFALEVRENLPDLILFDLNMPGRSGWDFIEEFSNLNLPKEIPAFIFTSALTPIELERSRRYEAIKGVILKPLTIQKMNKILRICGLECLEFPETHFVPFYPIHPLNNASGMI